MTERGADTEVRVSGTERAKTEALEMIAERLDNGNRRDRSPTHEDRRSSDRHKHSPEHRAAINILVLEEHVARLIGRNGDNVKKLKNRTGAHITFQKEVTSTQPTTEVKPESTTKFKVCTIEGTPSQIEDAVKAILDNIKRLQDY